MDGAQTNSVRNLQSLYSLVIGLALGQAVLTVVDASLFPVPLNVGALPLFAAYLLLVIPFYHGALRHLDVTYVEEGGREVRSGALLVDFSILFLEGCLLVALAALLLRPEWFAWCFVLLLAVDVVWGFIAHLAFTQTQPSKAESTWALLNLAAAGLLVIVLVLLRYVAPETQDINRSLSIIVPTVALLRTVADYWTCWQFYYPPLSELSGREEGRVAEARESAVEDDR